MKPFSICARIPLCCAALSFLAAAPAGEPKTLQVQVYDQIVAKVNSESISKRDVEERMNGIAERLYAFKKEKTAAGQWDKDAEAEWTKMYVEHFQPALQACVRDRLKLQYFEIEKMSVDDKDYQKELQRILKQLRDNGNRNFEVGEISKRVKENMKLDEFGGKFTNSTELPRRPEVERYYSENMDSFKRKAGAKIRIIRIDQTITDKLTGVKKVRDNAYGMLEEIRKDIVEFGALFSEVARTKSDDTETREFGGLLGGNEKDPYVVAEDLLKSIATATRDLKVGEVSPIFSVSTGFAIVMVEDRRDAGYIPLEGNLYDQLYRKVRANKAKKKEDEWFRATLAKSLILQVVEGNVKPLPISFFFPDDKKPDDKGGPDLIANDGKKPVASEKK